MADLPTSAGADVAKEIGDNATFVATDVSCISNEIGHPLPSYIPHSLTHTYILLEGCHQSTKVWDEVVTP